MPLDWEDYLVIVGAVVGAGASVQTQQPLYLIVSTAATALVKAVKDVRDHRRKVG